MLSEISNSVGNIVRRKEENHERRVKRVGLRTVQRHDAS